MDNFKFICRFRLHLYLDFWKPCAFFDWYVWRENWTATQSMALQLWSYLRACLLSSLIGWHASGTPLVFQRRRINSAGYKSFRDNSMAMEQISRALTLASPLATLLLSISPLVVSQALVLETFLQTLMRKKYFRFVSWSSEVSSLCIQFSI